MPMLGVPKGIQPILGSTANLLDEKEYRESNMRTEQDSRLKPILPLIISALIIATLLLLSFIYKIYEYPLWIDEGGIIETASAVGYFLCALLILLKGKWSYIKKYNYFFILVILCGFRELDFDKKFTTMGIFKSRFYISGSVPAVEKFIGLLVIAILLYIVVSVFRNHLKDFFRKIKTISPVHIGSLMVFLTMCFTKTIDGLARKLGDVNIHINQQTSTYFEVIEEVLELGIPLLMITTFIIYFSIEKLDK